jgi:hypothetical protein
VISLPERAGLLLACLLLAGQGGALGQISSSGRALLVRGADPVRGLPFFAPNALPGLIGAYSMGGPASQTKVPPAAPELSIWYTREPLVLGSSWRRDETYGSGAFLLARPQDQVLVLKAPGYYLFFELTDLSGAAPSDQGRRAFIRAFVRKFSAFFQSAASDAELSFPAYVDY